MAQYPITYACGHSTTVNLVGKTDERTRKLAWMQTVPCMACKRAAEQAAAESSAADAGLPALTGSDKQISWATTIRADMLRKIADERSRFERGLARNPAPGAIPAEELAKFDALVEILTGKTAASWWIDRRSSGPMSLLREVMA